MPNHFTTTASDTLDISDSVVRIISDHHTNSNTITISDSLLRHIAILKTKANTIDISDTTIRGIALHKINLETLDIRDQYLNVAINNDILDISNTVVVGGHYIQLDTWRPIPKPTDNSLILVCRTPATEHDSQTGLGNLSLWVLRPDGSNERLVMRDPTLNGYGWLRQSHPEWSPDGNTVVLATETSTQYQLVFVNSSAYGL